MRTLLILLFLFISAMPAKAQSLFEVTCRLPGIKHRIADAFIVYNKDSSGFVRIAWYDSVRKEKILTDLQLMPKSAISFMDMIDSDWNWSGIDTLASDFFGCTAVLIKNVQGGTPFPADSFYFWLRQGRDNVLTPYTGNMPRFDTSHIHDKIPGETSHMSFPTRFYSNYRDYFPTLLGFSDSPNILGYRVLTPKDLTYSFLKDYFTREEMVYPFPISVAQLDTIRLKDKVTLYCITATDVSDDLIGKTTVIDRNHIDNFFEGAAKKIDIKYKRIRLEKSDFNRARLESTIRSLHVGSNDIVVFAYSGHGFSYKNDPAFQYPQLALWHGPHDSTFFRTQSLNLETVFDLIRKKGARLNIVIGDCCNTDAGITRHVDQGPLGFGPGPIPDILKRRNYMRLLIEAKGSYISCAASKGEAAASNTGLGGIFTYCFLYMLEKQITPPHRVDPTRAWTEVLQETRPFALRIASGFKCEAPNVPCRQTLVFRKAEPVTSNKVKHTAPRRER